MPLLFSHQTRDTCSCCQTRFFFFSLRLGCSFRLLWPRPYESRRAWGIRWRMQEGKGRGGVRRCLAALKLLALKTSFDTPRDPDPPTQTSIPKVLNIMDASFFCAFIARQRFHARSQEPAWGFAPQRNRASGAPLLLPFEDFAGDFGAQKNTDRHGVCVIRFFLPQSCLFFFPTKMLFCRSQPAR